MKKKTAIIFSALTAAVLLMSAVCLFVGPSGMSFSECFSALLGKGSAAGIRIIRHIRVPRMLAALIAGAGLSVSGLIMQTSLNNSMASPSTLGVSNAAAFGANLSIIVLSGGFFDVGNNLSGYFAAANPYAAGLSAFIFSLASVLLILALSKAGSFSPGFIVLSGIALGSVWSAATSVIQFYATDVGLSAAVIWTFGDLGRATYMTDLIMLAAVAPTVAVFMLMSWKFNALLGGDGTAVSLGVNTSRLRFVSLLLASVITALCVSALGIIGFVGIICPHIAKKLLGQDHRLSVPASALIGSLLLLCADALSRIIGSGSALPVGAITSLLGAPLFIGIIIGKRRDGYA